MKIKVNKKDGSDIEIEMDQDQLNAFTNIVKELSGVSNNNPIYQPSSESEDGNSQKLETLLSNTEEILELLKNRNDSISNKEEANDPILISDFTPNEEEEYENLNDIVEDSGLEMYKAKFVSEEAEPMSTKRNDLEFEYIVNKHGITEETIKLKDDHVIPNSTVFDDGTILINCTDHYIGIDEGGTDARLIASCGIVPRLNYTKEEVGNGKIPILTIIPLTLTNMPPRQDGTYYIVSRIVFDSSDRNDLLRPEQLDATRNDKGHVITVKKFRGRK